MTIRALPEHEIEKAAAMLAEAFVGGTFASILGTDPATRLAASRWAFGGYLRYGLEFGEVLVLDDLAAVSIWWAPEHVFPDEQAVRAAGLANRPDCIDESAWLRYQAYGASADEMHSKSIGEPHWYLVVIGVAAEMQGRGLGGRLLRATLDRLDHEQVPAYLDTGLDANVTFYERHGFVKVAEERDPVSGILIRGMRRDPREHDAGPSSAT